MKNLLYIYEKYVIKSFLKCFFVCLIFFLFVSFLGTYLEDNMKFSRAFFLASFELLYILDIVVLFSSVIFFILTKNKFNYDIIRFYGKKQIKIFIFAYYIILIFSLLTIFIVKPMVIKKIHKTEIEVKNNLEFSTTKANDDVNKDFFYVNDKDLFMVSMKKSRPIQIILSNDFKNTDNQLILNNATVISLENKSVFFNKKTTIDIKLQSRNNDKPQYKIDTIYKDITYIIEDFKNIYKKKEYIYSSINIIKEINLIILSIFNFNLVLIFLNRFSRLKNLLIDVSKIIFIFFISKNFIKFLQSIYIKYGHGLFISTICALLMLFISFYKIERSENGA